MKKQKTKKDVKYQIAIITSVIISAAVIGHFGQKLEHEAGYIAPAVIVTKKVQPKAIDQIPAKHGVIREVTMYTSREQETDASPCISADGTNICHVNYNVCASNAHKIGQRLIVKGLGECIVRDRMNSRYTQRIDWYAKYDLIRALKFGKQKLEVIEL